MAQKSKKSLKKEAWSAFSAYIRTRDCLRFSGNPDNGKCVTCNREYPYKKLQAGHFIGGRTNAVLFDERIVYSQCYGCNVGKSGSYLEYFYFMESEIGRSAIDNLVVELKAKKVAYSSEDYIYIKSLYEKKREGLLTRQNT